MFDNHVIEVSDEEREGALKKCAEFLGGAWEELKPEEMLFRRIR